LISHWRKIFQIVKLPFNMYQ